MWEAIGRSSSAAEFGGQPRGTSGEGASSSSSSEAPGRRAGDGGSCGGEDELMAELAALREEIRTAKHGLAPFVQDSALRRTSSLNTISERLDSCSSLLWPLVIFNIQAPQSCRIIPLADEKILLRVKAEPPTTDQAINLVRWCWQRGQLWLAGRSLLSVVSFYRGSAGLRWVLLVTLLRLWREASFGKVGDYVVDNAELRASTHGLGYRFSKDLGDLDTAKAAFWGCVVTGTSRGDGWLRVGSLFLPFTVSGCRVLAQLEPQREQEQCAAALGPGQNTPPRRSPGRSSPDRRDDSDDQLPSLEVRRMKAERHRLRRERLNHELQELDRRRRQLRESRRQHSEQLAARGPERRRMKPRRERFSSASTSDDSHRRLAEDLKRALRSAEEERRRLEMRRETAVGARRRQAAMRASGASAAEPLWVSQHPVAHALHGFGASLCGSRPSEAHFLARLQIAEQERENARRELQRARAEYSAEVFALRRAAQQPKLAVPPPPQANVAADASIAALRAEIAELGHKVRELETAVPQPPMWSPDIFDKRAAEIAERQRRIAEEEADLDRARQRVLSLDAELAGTMREDANRRERAEELRRSAQVSAERDELLRSAVSCAAADATARAVRYEELKRELFAYGALLARGPHFLKRDGIRRSGKRRSGIQALIEALAYTCGLPEIAFLYIDTRRDRKLSPESLGVGLLLGVRIDYPQVAGISIQALFSAIDRHDSGAITSADLGSCCPHIWATHGASVASAREKLRSLPWNAAGGQEEAFNWAKRESGASPDEGLGRLEFDDIVYWQFRGVSLDEAGVLFPELADEGWAISRPAWAEATAELPLRASAFCEESFLTR